MSKIITGVSVQDELNVYLVANGLKPASLVGLEGLYFEDKYDIRREGNSLYIYEESDIRLQPESVQEFSDTLERLGLVYHQDGIHTWQIHNEAGTLINTENILFSVGKDQRSLDKLLNAKSDVDRGLALGFPKEAVYAFGKKVDGEVRDGNYFLVSLAKGKKAGMESPTWLAYLSHMPELLDLVGGNVSESSKALGHQYRSFVWQTNPELAQRVEQHFLARRLPKSWDKQADGSYNICFM